VNIAVQTDFIEYTILLLLQASGIWYRWPFLECTRMLPNYITVLCYGVLASEDWWEAWQPSHKVTRSY